jgi:hypothetical protein
MILDSTIYCSKGKKDLPIITVPFFMLFYAFFFALVIHAPSVAMLPESFSEMPKFKISEKTPFLSLAY